MFTTPTATAWRSTDCLGVPGGSATISTPCDDGDANTGGDIYGNDCVALDGSMTVKACPGALPRSARRVMMAMRLATMYSTCNCAGEVLDCRRSGGPATVALLAVMAMRPLATMSTMPTQLRRRSAGLLGVPGGWLRSAPLAMTVIPIPLGISTLGCAGQKGRRWRHGSGDRHGLR